jgi:NAD(P)-dependent dehydrogenase (short-subunit alcohol dehydrogenase family)
MARPKGEPHESMNVLVIGGTTFGGIGWTFARYMVDNFPDAKVITPPIEALDVREPQSIKAGLSQMYWDYVLYAAGVNYISPLQNLPEADLLHIFDVNVMGYIRVMSELASTQSDGRVCAVTGISSRIPMRYTTPYCSSKAALVHAIRCVAKEMGPNWQITGVAPGTIQSTEMSEEIDQQILTERGWNRNELLTRELKREPFGRRIYPGEIAMVIADIFMGPPVLTGTIVDIAGGA